MFFGSQQKEYAGIYFQRLELGQKSLVQSQDRGIQACFQKMGSEPACQHSNEKKGVNDKKQGRAAC